MYMGRGREGGGEGGREGGRERERERGAERPMSTTKMIVGCIKWNFQMESAGIVRFIASSSAKPGQVQIMLTAHVRKKKTH